MQRILVYLTILGLFLAACSTPSGPVALPTEVGPTPADPTPAEPTEETPIEAPTPVEVPAAANAAVQALAQLLGLDPSQITVINVEAVEWSDSCLGIVRIDALCAQGSVPGYRLTLEANGQQYEFHTNEDGSAYALAPATAATAAEAAVNAARAALVQRLGLADYQVNPVSISPVEWPDACLGVVRIGVLCAQGVTPGYRVILDVNGQLYAYHTNEEGTSLALAPMAAPTAAAAAIQAAREALAKALGLSDAEISVVSVAAMEWPNACLGVTLPGMGCAEVITPGYNVVLEANGVVHEYHTDAAGASVQPASVALSWQRQGGIAGFCDELIVYRSGEVVGLDCKGDQVSQGTLATTLSEADLAQFNGWLTQYGAVTVAHEDGAVADAMSVTLNLNGLGAAQPGEAEQQAMVEWAQNLYAQLQPAG